MSDLNKTGRKNVRTILDGVSTRIQKHQNNLLAILINTSGLSEVLRWGITYFLYYNESEGEGNRGKEKERTSNCSTSEN